MTPRWWSLSRLFTQNPGGQHTKAQAAKKVVTPVLSDGQLTLAASSAHHFFFSLRAGHADLCALSHCVSPGLNLILRVSSLKCFIRSVCWSACVCYWSRCAFAFVWSWNWSKKIIVINKFNWCFGTPIWKRIFTQNLMSIICNFLLFIIIWISLIDETNNSLAALRRY